jgi:hypothetical protein
VVLIVETISRIGVKKGKQVSGKSDGQIIAQAAKDLIDLESSRLRQDSLVKALKRAHQALENLAEMDITPDVLDQLCGGDMSRFFTYRRTCQEMLNLWADAFSGGATRQAARAGLLGNILTDLLQGKLSDEQAAVFITKYATQPAQSAQPSHSAQPKS